VADTPHHTPDLRIGPALGSCHQPQSRGAGAWVGCLHDRFEVEVEIHIQGELDLVVAVGTGDCHAQILMGACDRPAVPGSVPKPPASAVAPVPWSARKIRHERGVPIGRSSATVITCRICAS
jgi:hypothetical protein